MVKEQGKLGKDALVEMSESWQKSCVARTLSWSPQMDHGEMEQWSHHFTIAGEVEGPQHGKEREIWDSSRAV